MAVRARPNALGAAAVGELRSHLRGALIEPRDGAYATARLVANAACERSPALIVRATDSDDVLRALEFASRWELPLAVRSGGHSVPGHSTGNGALVIDLSRMRRLEIDPTSSIARVQPGLTAGEYAERADAFGLGTTFGDNGAVGIGGLTLGGGIGFLARRDGLTVDQLLAAEMVTVDGRRVTASAKEHPDLFWALRGGGGNFGVVTDLRFRIRPAGTIYGGWLILPATREVIRDAVAASINAPDALTTIINVMRLPALPGVPAERVGELAVVITAVHSGEPKRTGPAAGGLSATDLRAAESAFRPFRSLGRPILDRVGPRPYPELFGFFGQAPVPARRASARRNTFLDDLDDALTDAILDFTARTPSLIGVAQLRVLGGAVSRIPADATAFAHRDRQTLLMLSTEYEAGSDPAPHLAWIEQFWAVAAPHGSGAYVGFLSGDEPSDVHAAYPDPTYARLAAVKRTWDPTNRLRLNHNIQPGPEPSASRSPV